MPVPMYMYLLQCNTVISPTKSVLSPPPPEKIFPHFIFTPDFSNQHQRVEHLSFSHKSLVVKRDSGIIIIEITEGVHKPVNRLR